MQRDELETLVRNGWDAVADRYADELYHELDRKPYDRDLLARFAAMVTTDLPVLDLGCGPGHISAHLAKMGLWIHGIDLSPEMVRVAKERSPDLGFEVGNLLDLELAENSLGGVVALYSLINLLREDVPLALERISHALAPGAPLLIAVHHGQGELRATEVLGKPVEMVATLFTREELCALAVQAGLTVAWSDRRDPYQDEYQTQRVYLLCTKGASLLGTSSDDL